MATEYSNLIVERLGTDNHLARITLNRPEKVNALSGELYAEFNDCLHDLETDHECRVIILRGAGRGFSAGYDLTGGRGNGRPRRKAVDEKGRRFLMEMRASLQDITDIQMYYWNMHKITIAQVHGPCLAGGCELAMMSDLVVAADDAQIGHPGLRGLGTARNACIWPLVMGMRKAKELYYTGDSISGRQAEAYGMINHSWPAEELEARTFALAERVAIMSSDHLAVLKVTMNRFYENMGIYSSVRSATELDAMAQLTEFSYAFNDKFAAEGFKAAFHWRDALYNTRNAPSTTDSDR